jgi:hypothetical protein
MKKWLLIVLMLLPLHGYAKPKQVKILFCECKDGFTQFSAIQRFDDWFAGSSYGLTNTFEMVKQGWTIVTVTPAGAGAAAKQFYITFTK